MNTRMSRLYKAAVGLLFAIPLTSACDSAATPTVPLVPTATVSTPKVTADYDFSNGTQGWEAGFSDYPPGEDANYQLDSGMKALPTGVTPAGTAFYTSGNNHSDDLFMFLKRKLGQADGVKPNTTYKVKFKITFASNAQSGCSGIGGSPGESVTLKAGTSDVEPKPIAQNNIYKMNVNKGEQTTGGPAGEVVSNISNGQPCAQSSTGTPPYVSLSKTHVSDAFVKSSATGDLWLLIGTDSGFEGTTSLYYQHILVELVPGS